MKILNRITACVVIAVLAFSMNKADAQIFEKGSADLNFQMGFGSSYYITGDINVGLPLISFAADIGLRDDWGPGIFGIGGLVGLSTYKRKEYTWLYDDYGYKSTRFIIAPRATYHYQFVDKLDTYGGIISGLDFRTYSTYGDWPYNYDPDTDTDVNVVFSAFAGVKYYFTENFAVMSELYVYDMAAFNIGVCLKLK